MSLSALRSNGWRLFPAPWQFWSGHAQEDEGAVAAFEPSGAMSIVGESHGQSGARLLLVG